MELTLYAQNNTNFLSNSSKLHFGFKLLYSTICHKRSELFKYFSGLQHIAQGKKSVGGELLEHWLPIWAWEWDWGLSPFLDDLKSFFGLFVNKGVRLMAYFCLWMTLSWFLAMSKYRLKLSPNMDIRFPRHSTRASRIWIQLIGCHELGKFVHAECFMIIMWTILLKRLWNAPWGSQHYSLSLGALLVGPALIVVGIKKAKKKFSQKGKKKRERKDFLRFIM